MIVTLKKSTVPTFPKTFSSMMLSLKSLFQFKVRIYINIFKYIQQYSYCKKSLIEVDALTRQVNNLSIQRKKLVVQNSIKAAKK